jgi:hypothetical protein
MGSDPRRILYNKENFQQEVKVKVLNNSSNPNDELLFEQVLYNDNILKIEIMNDLVNPIPVGKILFDDIGNKIFHNIRTDGNSFISINISRLDIKNEINDIFKIKENLNHEFLITNIKVLDKRLEGVTYEIKLISSKFFNMNNNLIYSSYGEKPTTEILKELLIQGGLKISNDQINESNVQIHYISPSDFTLIDNLNHVLEETISKQSGIYFISYNFSKDRYKIISLNQTYLKEIDLNLINPDNILNLPTRDQTFEVHKTINSIKKMNMNGSHAMLELSKGIANNNYDYVNREWKRELYEFDKIMDILPPTQNPKLFRKKIKSEPKYIPSDIRNFQTDLAPKDSSFYKKARDLFLYSNTLEFKCYGVLNREVSDFIRIDLPKKSELYLEYFGLWYTSRIFHVFERSTYHNVLQCCRFDESIKRDFELKNTLNDNIVNTKSFFDELDISKAVED